MNPNEAITIVTTVCAIPSHPSTWIMDAVYQSGRFHLPNARWLFLFDGVHEIQEDMRSGYELSKRIVKWRIDEKGWSNSYYVEFPAWGHQASMIREALRGKIINTPLVLWLEHDFPLERRSIDWHGITDALLANEICYVRFCLPEETTESLAACYEPIPNRFGLPLMKTLHYSSLPNVCRLDFLEEVAKLSGSLKDHIECVPTEGIGHYGGGMWRLAVYTPSGVPGRFFSLDGRQGRIKPREP
jgi:hypothetical protein